MVGRIGTEKYYYFYGMKIKPFIYLLAIIAGALLMGMGERLMRQEYAMCLGIILIMFGIYKTSVSWGNEDKETEEKE